MSGLNLVWHGNTGSCGSHISGLGLTAFGVDKTAAGLAGLAFGTGSTCIGTEIESCGIVKTDGLRAVFAGGRSIG